MSDASKAASPKRGAAARSEVNGHRPTVEFEGLTLTLPAKIPFRVVRYMRGGNVEDVAGMLGVLLGEEQLEKVWALDIDIDRGGELVDEVMDAMGSDTGKSAASPKS